MQHRFLLNGAYQYWKSTRCTVCLRLMFVCHFTFFVQKNKDFMHIHKSLSEDIGNSLSSSSNKHIANSNSDMYRDLISTVLLMCSVLSIEHVTLILCHKSYETQHNC